MSRYQLQVYLDEFVLRHNPRRLPMAAFQTLLGLGTGRKPTAYNEIRGAASQTIYAYPNLQALLEEEAAGGRKTTLPRPGTKPVTERPDQQL